MAEVATQSKGSIFSPEGLLMLGIFGILDIIDFFVASILIVDIIATLFYLVWVYFRSQAKAAGEAQRVSEMLAKKKEKKKAFQEKRAAKKTSSAKIAKKGKWLRRSLFLLEWIPIIGMIPGWTLMVYSELKD